MRIHAKVICGGQPDGPKAFRELEAMGVKVIISVDSARPDVATASRYHLRYIHLPHGYDGIPKGRATELAKAVRDLEGPIYIHCHHGKHRGPTAAAVACVGSGLLEPESAVAVLRSAGTGENYRGLYQSAESASRFEARFLDSLKVEFRETVPVPPFAESMVSLDQAHEHLKEISLAGWKASRAHPDLDPAHEALLLRESLTELSRTQQVQGQPKRFRDRLRECEAAGMELEAVLRAWNHSGGAAPIPQRVSTAFDRVSQSCTGCHKEFRDVPLGGKGRG
jgi:hypothetical protein